MRVDLLGPLRVHAGDREIDLGGPRNRALVARLALDAGRPVAAATLIDDLWGLDVPADATNALQSIVSRTRRRLPDGALESTPAGYVLQGAEVDAAELERLVAAGRADEALALWRGPALAELAELPFAASAAHRLEELRLTAVEASLRARVHAGDPGVVAELAELTDAHPYRDGFWLLHLSALAGQGRAAEALTAYERLRAQLADELGTDPSPQLQELHLAILRGEHGARHHPALPSALTSFVGRESAIADLRAALADHRLVTILGPGGAGKTRLAVEVARAALDGFDEVWLTELAPVTGSDGILEAILSAMGLLEVSVLDRQSSSGRADERTRLLDAVRDVEGLLLLDNCEHLVDAVAGIAEDLLARAPKLQVLATSREPLRIIGEYAYQLSPLTMPAETDSVEDALRHSAVELFVQRAQAVDQTFALTPETLPAVREICVRLDGQPLAIELAAARLRTLTAAQVAARLSDRFRLLTGGSRTALPRHRTLRAVVEWSWDLLDEAERDLAERLAVFPGGITAESAAAVAASADRVEELLDSLVDKSLLVPVRGETPRFRMLETIREFGTDRLVDRDAAEPVREAHLRHFLAVAETHGPGLRTRDQVVALHALNADRANIVAALRFAIDRGDRASAGRLVAALAWYWTVLSQHEEAYTWADAVLRLPGEADPATEIALTALSLTGVMVTMMSIDGDTRGWDEPVRRILALWDEHHPDDPVVHVVMATLDFFGVIGDRVLPETTDGWTRAMINLMRLVLLDNAGRTDELESLLAPTIEGFRSLGDRWGLATALSQQGTARALSGDFEAARASWEEAIPLVKDLGATEDVDFAELQIAGLEVATADQAGLERLRERYLTTLSDALRSGNRRAEIFCRMTLAAIERGLDHERLAIDHLQSVLRRFDTSTEFGGGQMESALRAGMAASWARLGDRAGAESELDRAITLATLTRDMPVMAMVGVTSAELARIDGDLDLAARRLGACEAVRGRQDRLSRDIRRLTEVLTAALGPERFAELYARGSGLDRDAAIRLALPGAVDGDEPAAG